MPRTKQFCEEEILVKAMELFWKKGFHATSISDLVKHLGINRASLYDTYGGKKELFDKAFLLYRNTNKQRIISFLDNQPSVKVGISKLFEVAIDQAVADKDHKGCFVVNMSTELAPGDEQLSSVLADHKNQMEKIFIGYLEKGVKSGELSQTKDLKSIASLLFTLYGGIMVVAKIEPDRKKLLDASEAALAILD